MSIKWSIRRLFLLTLVAPIMASSKLRNSYCEFQCSFKPNTNHGEEYAINCEDPNYLPTRDCFLACDTCNDMCNINESPVSIRCPKIQIEGVCKTRCDFQRPDSILDAFSFNCNDRTMFPTTWEVRQCIKDCYSCRNFCSEQKTTFYCPPVEVFPPRPPPPTPEPLYDDSKCEWRCDHERPVTDRTDESAAATGYVLKCGAKYPHHKKDRANRLSCIADCSTCPLDVCDPTEAKGVFTCPASRVARKGEIKPKKFIGSWIVIALIAISTVGCIISSSLYGRLNEHADAKLPVQVQKKRAERQQEHVSGTAGV